MAASSLVSNRRLRPDEIQALIRGYHGSGLTQVAFAARHQIPISTFTYWLRRERLKKHEAPDRLVPVKLRPAATPPPMLTAWVEVALRGGRALRIPADVFLERLEDIIRAIEGAC